MFKIGILEDEKQPAEDLLKFLDLFFSQQPDLSYTVTWYNRGMALLKDYKRDFDFLFLDIQLPDITGMQAATQIRMMDENVTILFVPNLAQYAIQGYSVQAFDYILKPVSYPSFCQKMERAIQSKLRQSNDVYLDIRTKKGSIRLSCDSIFYIEIYNHTLMIHTDQGVLEQWGSLSKYEKMLSDSHFSRCNASYLVNLKYVSSMERDKVKIQSAWLPIGRTRKKKFLEDYSLYKGGIH